MARISTLSRAQLPDFEPMFQILDNTMGYIPNNFLSMAHWPELLSAFGGLAATILQTGEVEGSLKQLVAMVASTANGCHYCQAHTLHTLQAIWVYRRKKSMRLSSLKPHRSLPHEKGRRFASPGTRRFSPMHPPKQILSSCQVILVSEKLSK